MRLSRVASAMTALIDNRAGTFAAFCLVLILAASPCVVRAQVNGSINGTLVDATQAAVPGALLVLRNVDTAETRQLTTSEQGYFYFAALPRGQYNIKVSVA